MLLEKDTLMAKVYKCKYFPKTNVLSARLGSRPSYAWRSILSAQETLRAGCRMVIGDGESINMWEDPWLGRKPAHPLEVTSQIPLHLQQEVGNMNKVADLLQGQGRDWKTDILEVMLPQGVQEEVSRLRPRGRETKDTFTWDYTKSGFYTVKSGYWVERERQEKMKGNRQLLQPSLDMIYQKIWQVEAPPKIRHFLWRCLSNALAVSGNLAKRHLTREAGCGRCMETETVNHLLFTCPYARVVWAVSPEPAPEGGEWVGSFYTNLYGLINPGNLTREQQQQLVLVPWLLWRLWKNRNDLIFKGRELGAGEVVIRAKEDMEEWERRKSGTRQVDRPQEQPQRIIKWKKPPETWVKCNTDGAWEEPKQRSGLGWVLRDHEGRVLWLGAKAVPQLEDALEAEAEALRWALLSMIQLGYTRLIFETDAANLVSLIEERNRSMSLLPIIQDIQTLLKKIGAAYVVFSHRETNGVAHRMAKEAISFSCCDSVLYSRMPSWVNKHVWTDNDVTHVG